MKYKGHKITVEKISGYVWIIEKPDGETLSIDEAAALHDDRAGATDDAKSLIDELTASPPKE